MNGRMKERTCDPSIHQMYVRAVEGTEERQTGDDWHLRGFGGRGCDRADDFGSDQRSIGGSIDSTKNELRGGSQSVTLFGVSVTATQLRDDDVPLHALEVGMRRQQVSDTNPWQASGRMTDRESGCWDVNISL